MRAVVVWWRRGWILGDGARGTTGFRAKRSMPGSGRSDSLQVLATSTWHRARGQVSLKYFSNRAPAGRESETTSMTSPRALRGAIADGGLPPPPPAWPPRVPSAPTPTHYVLTRPRRSDTSRNSPSGRLSRQGKAGFEKRTRALVRKERDLSIGRRTDRGRLSPLLVRLSRSGMGSPPGGAERPCAGQGDDRPRLLKPYGWGRLPSAPRKLGPDA